MMKLHLSKNIYFCLSLIALLALSSCKKDAPNSFTIEGSIKNLKGNSILFVRDFPDSVKVDTIKVEKGDFKLKGVTDTLMIGTLYFNNGASSTSLFVDKGVKVKVEGDANLPDLIEIKGGDVNDDLTEFKKKNKSVLTSRAKLMETIQKETPQNGQSKPNPDMISKISNLNFQLTNSAAEYIKKNPEKIASVILIQDFFKDEHAVDQMDKKLQILKEPASKFPLTYQLRQYVSQIKSSDEGAVAPYFAIKDSKGVETRIDEFRGRYLILSFASSDCPLCLKNRQELSSINTKYKGNLVVTVSVLLTNKSNGGDMPKPAPDAKVDWRVVTPKEGWAAKVLADYNVNELPLNILISPDGKILAREESTTMIQSKLPKIATAQ